MKTDDTESMFLQKLTDVADKLLSVALPIWSGTAAPGTAGMPDIEVAKLVIAIDELTEASMRRDITGAVIIAHRNFGECVIGRKRV